MNFTLQLTATVVSQSLPKNSSRTSSRKMLIYKLIATYLFATATCLNFIISRSSRRAKELAKERERELEAMKSELNAVWVGSKIFDNFDQMIDEMVQEPELNHINLHVAYGPTHRPHTELVLSPGDDQMLHHYRDPSRHDSQTIYEKLAAKFGLL